VDVDGLGLEAKDGEVRRSGSLGKGVKFLPQTVFSKFMSSTISKVPVIAVARNAPIDTEM
jgi:hypothetical protein